MSFKLAFLLLVSLLAVKVAFGQTYFAPLYSETFGTPSANTNIWSTGQYTGFKDYLGNANAAANYYGAPGQTGIASARTSTPSSTYSIPAILNNGSTGTFSASGNGFCPGSTTTTSGFGIQNINTSGVAAGDELWLGFGAAKTAAASAPSVDWSSDGSTWNSVSVTFVSTTAWTYYTFQLPSGAKTANLRLRFNNGPVTGSPQTRFDDIRIAQFTPATGPVITSSFTGLNKMYGTAAQASDPLSFTVAGTNLTADIVVNAVTGFEFANAAVGPYSSTQSYTPVSGTVTTKTVYVRVAAGQAVSTYSGTMNVTSTGAVTASATLYGEVMNTTASTFGSSNLIVAQLGDANFTQTGVASPFFLLEITKAGALVQKVPMPFQNAGSNNRVTVSGASTTSAQLNLSPDKKYLATVGYSAPLNTAVAAAQSSAAFPKVIARIDYTGAINSTTLINDGYEGGDLRSAVTTNGTKFWTGGNGSATSGVRFVNFGSSGSSVGLDNNAKNMRYVNITNSQLFVGSQSGAYVGVNKVGTGLPETQVDGSTSLIASEANTYAFVFADQNASVPGNDVMYVADGSTGLFKYSYDGTTWTARGSYTGTPVYNVYAEDNGASVDVYFTTTDKLYVITDNSAQASNITGSGTAISSLTPIYTAPASTFLRGIVGTPQNVVTPDVNHTFTSPATTLTQGANDQGIYRIQIDVTNGPAVLSTLTATTGGNYQSADISGFNLIRSTDNVLDAGDAVFATIGSSTSTGTGETLVFNSAESFAVGTHYIFVVADVSGCATVGRTINVNTVPLANIEYFSSNSTGTPAAGSSYTINTGSPSPVTGLSITTGGSSLPISWTNPACLDQILVVADRVSITTAPNGAATYTANANYNTGGGTLFGTTGRVVYQGTGNSFTLSGLTLNQTYYVKVFVKRNGVYSTGVETSATAVQTTFYSRASGIASSGTIWALTPNGTAATAASLGGFSSTTNIVVQNGHTVTMNASNLAVRDLTVNAGGTFTSTATYPSSLQYMLLYGTLTNNGTFGGSTVAIGIGPEGATSAIVGNNPVYIARINKRQATVPSSAITLSGTVYLGFNGNAITPNVASRMDVTIAAGANVVLNGGSVASVGIDGNGTDAAEKAGTITVNGKLDAGSALYAFNNNTISTNTTPVVIGSTGTLLVDSALVAQTTTAPSLFTINSGGAFKVRRHLTLASGNLAPGLQLLSTNGVTARLAALGTGQTVGAITVERTMPAAAGWHFIGAPVQSKFFTDWTGLGARLTPKNNANLFYYTEGDTTRGTYNGYLTEVNGWKVLPSTAQPINPSDQITGYRLYTAASQKLSITGVPFIGDQTRNLTKTSTGYAGGGWNLIANPYPSEIDWDAFKTLNSSASLTGTVYIWNGTTKQYSTYAPGIGGTNGGSRYIQSGQGFQVKVTAPLTVTFKENQKAIVSTAGSYLRSGIANSVHMFLENGTASDEGLLVFRSDATIGFDSQLDAYKLPGSDLNISTLPMSGLNLAVNAMPELTATQVIPVRTDVSANGTYTIRFTGVETLDAGLVMYLRDNYLNTLTDLTQTSTYAFTVTNNPATKAGRFEIVAGPASVTGIAKGVKTALTVFPNPAQGAFTVAATGLKGSTALVQVMTADGRVSFSSTSAVGAEGTLEVPVQTRLAAGVYTVRMVSAGQTVTQKLVVE